MLGKSERRRIHGLILATLLHSGGPLLMVFLAERPTPTTRQVSSGGPPPQVLRDPGQPRLMRWRTYPTIPAATDALRPRRRSRWHRDGKSVLSRRSTSRRGSMLRRSTAT